MPGRTIVVGVDGSDASLAAAHFAAGLAEDMDDAQVVIVFARYIYLMAPASVAEDIFSDVLDAAEQTALENAGEVLAGRPLRWKFEVREGEPAEVLRSVAADVDASLIIVGRRGWSTVRELILGSVSNRLVHHCDRPVLVVGSTPTA